MLELGCGDGANVLSMAQTLPGASFVGIDASTAAIERGGEIAAAAGLANVQLRAAQLQELPEDLGGFDYVVSHGVYSWISPPARGALLQCCRQRLGAQGIAYVSYNAYPGSHLRDMTREILRYHVRDVADPQERLAQAQKLMQTIVAIDEPSLYARALREQMERMLNYSDALAVPRRPRRDLDPVLLPRVCRARRRARVAVPGRGGPVGEPHGGRAGERRRAV